MRIALDIQALQVEGYADRGIGRYVSGYARALAQQGVLAACLLAPELPPPMGLPEVLATSVAGWDSARRCRRLCVDHPDLVYHVTAPFLHTGPQEPPALGIAEHWARAGVPRVTTLHDLIPLRAPRHYLARPGHRERFEARAEWVARSDLILTNSEHTRGEAVELLGCDPETVVTVGAGVSPFFRPADGSDEELFHSVLGSLDGRPFVLAVGADDIRKGTDRAIGAIGLLAARGVEMSLVVAGHVSPHWRQELEGTARAAGVASRVVFAGAVTDEVLRACYRRAVVTVMPSIAEGAGLPVLESAACGTPALASSTTALAETAAVPEALFDPTDIGSIADAIEAAASSPSRREGILAAQQALASESTWEAVADRAVAAISRLGRQAAGAVGSAGRLAGRLPSRRIALVGPLPPAGGGIGLYNFDLLEAMVSCGVTVDAVTTSGSTSRTPPGAACLSADSFGVDVRPAAYDAVVYTVGNSDGHLPAVELSLRYPGWVWLHEVHLPAVATTGLADLDPARFQAAMDWLVRRAYPGRPPVDAARRAGRSHVELAESGIGLTPLILERVAGILVNSEAARRLLDLQLPPLAATPPIRVLPHAFLPVATERPRPDGEPLVAAFGIVSMVKRPDVLVDAAAVAKCRLAFVGPCPPILEQFLRERAERLGIADRVEVVGGVDDEAWEAWMRRASLVVQLRDSRGGETSGPLRHALSLGVPVLTNLASAAEYPDGTVALVHDLGAEALGQRIRDLLASPDRLVRLSDAGRQYASEHQFSHLAAALAAAVLE